MTRDVRVAVFRPDDERMAEAVKLLDSLGATPVPDPMLAVEPTGAVPDGADDTPDPDIVVLTSKTGVELLADAGWSPGEATLVCIGPRTAAAARDAGWTVDIVPEEYTSSGLVETLADEVDGRRVEVARSDHGSDVLLDGLRDAGADVHETVLYRLVRPEGSGQSTVMAAGGELDAVCFTSSLTVANFLDAADERGVREEAVAGLNRAVVGVIGDPTRETAEGYGIRVDVVPENATFEELATEVVETAAPTYHE
ncbi:uroporphyrinogen-III synthase [Halobellus sp. Atlit-38R]|uniref:uroporphyrinogen-III synthase n=1 Tax=Halobellus sp. Atlit-38R TaxID=2282131 RepID=UPI000EF1DD5E|nr:uroporphyrinogen-III synthase [Halobellus sp. Atlit-38R]RLM84175.1 uroporphyrinogen-III synthase [Halobellus sp. Atlit-38R]